MTTENERDVVARLRDKGVDIAAIYGAEEAEPITAAIEEITANRAEITRLRTALAASAAQSGGTGGEALRLLWNDLAAMVARARQQDSWHLMLDGHAQDLEQAEATLRQTRALATPPAETDSGAAPANAYSEDQSWADLRASGGIAYEEAVAQKPVGYVAPADLDDLARKRNVILAAPGSSCRGGAATIAVFTHPDTTPAASGQAVAQEPVAWFWREKVTGATGSCTSEKHRVDTAASPAYEVFPVFAHPAPSAASIRAEALAKPILDGWLTENNITAHDGPWYAQSLERMTRAVADALKTPHASREDAPHG